MPRPTRRLLLQTLKKRADFLAATRARRSAGLPGLVLQVRPWDDAPPTTGPGRDDGIDIARIGYTASKKVGNAVARNRAKRRLRSLAHDVLSRQALPERDYVLIARQATPTRPYAALKSDLETALKRLKAWRDIAT